LNGLVWTKDEVVEGGRGEYPNIKSNEWYCIVLFKREEGLSFSAVGYPPNYIKPLERR
jgi:hypothetical protein